jgi:serine/threonine protein kinase
MMMTKQQQQQQHEANVVRNIAHAVEEYATGLTRGAKFLNETGIESSVALFHSNEIALGKLLGKGGFSRVYEAAAFNLMQTQPSAAASELNLARRIVESTAIDYRGQATYALKHLDKKLLQNPDEFCAAAADLYVEAKYMSRFNHPNILKLRGMANGGTAAFQEGRYNSFFIVTDRLSDTLDDRIEGWGRQGQNLQESIVLKTNYALQVASALEYLHERRIVFRDIKPQNIGFKSNDTVQIFDFGLCRELPEPASHDIEETFKMSNAGTRRYMSPEIYVHSCYNLKVDCYSWAAVYYEMLSLEKPYARVSDVEFQTLVVGQGLRPKISHLSLPQHVNHVIQKAWAQQPTQRPTMKVIRMTLQGMLIQWELDQHQHQQMVSTPIPRASSPHDLFSVSSDGMDCATPVATSGSFGMWHTDPTTAQLPPQQQLSLSPSATPVFTFEQDLSALNEQHQQRAALKKKATSTDVTLTTENSTTYWDHDDLSIRTFDYSLTSLMELENSEPQASASISRMPTLEARTFGFP